MKSTNEHIGQFKVPTNISEYVERKGDRLVVEQTSFDVVNGYGAEIETRVQVQRLCESCDICGYHSYRNPHQKRLKDENRHRLTRHWETIWEWSTYDTDDISLADSWKEFISEE